MDLSKGICKNICRISDLSKREQIGKVLRELKGIKQIIGIKNCAKREHIAEMKGSQDKLQTSKDGIAFGRDDITGTELVTFILRISGCARLYPDPTD